MCDFSAYGGPSAEWNAVEATLPTPPSGLSVLERRDMINRGREEVSTEAMKTLVNKLKMSDYSIPTRDGSSIQARSYRLAHLTGKRLPVYVHLHGGGFLFGTLASEDAACARIAINSNVVVINVNYRHTPEFTYPTAWEDVEDAFTWLHENMSELEGDEQSVVLGGISAGAQLAASLVLRKNLGMVAASMPPITGQILVIPCLVHKDCYDPQLQRMKSPSVSSYVENENAPILPKGTIQMFLDLLKFGNLDENDLRLNPGNARIDQVRGLPPTALGIAGLDPLRDEGLLYAKMLSEAGVPTETHLFKGVPHGFRRFGDKLSASKHWDAVIEDGIAWALRKPTATGDFSVKVHE